MFNLRQIWLLFFLELKLITNFYFRQVVDGHKVEINETVFGNTNSVFKVRVVNVRPLDSGEEVAEGVHTNGGGFQPANSPATSAPPPAKSAGQGEFDDEVEEDGRREPLEKQPKDNEVRDIDEPKVYK